MGKFVATVGGAPSLLGEFDMETLEHLGVEIVRCAKELNHLDIVDEGVKLRNEKVLAAFRSDKVAFVLMPALESFGHVAKCRLVMSSVLGQIDEVEYGTDGGDSPRVEFVNDAA